MKTKIEVRDIDQIRVQFLAKLGALIDQARLTSKNTPFMNAQIDELSNGVLEGMQDTDRMRYLATDRENWRALYDLSEAREGTIAEGDDVLTNLRENIDDFIAMDADGEFDVQ